MTYPRLVAKLNRLNFQTHKVFHNNNEYVIQDYEMIEKRRRVGWKHLDFFHYE